MSDHAFLFAYMNKYFDEVPPKSFYRAIFPEGELAESGHQESGKYTGVAVELLRDSGQNFRRYTITDDLDMIDHLLESDEFIIISPISYAGKSRVSQNARFMYALAIDLDGVDTEQNITDLFHQIEIEHLPRPTYVVTSGNGLHLYYQFERPIPCFRNITSQLATLKQALTKRIWNKYVTTLHDKPQIQSLFQGFRMVGGVTKTHERTHAFCVGDVVTVEYLNNFIPPQHRVKSFTYKSELTLAEAKKKYPEWYDARIVHKRKKGTWTVKRDLYDWWKNRIYWEASEGHRYFCIMVLAIYAKKCDIPLDELERDAFGLVDNMDMLTTDEQNHFTREDVAVALEMYNDSYMTFPIHSIVEITNIPIERNRRNYRTQKEHLEEARALRDIRMKRQGRKWDDNNGRPKGSGTKQKLVEDWQQAHPHGRKADCSRDLGISRPTIDKYWKSE